MTDNEMLIKLMIQCFKKCLQTKCKECSCFEVRNYDCRAKMFADHLIANGVVVQKQGEWEKIEDDYCGLHIIKCSLCHEEWCFEIEDDVSLLNYKFCPNCGAKMVKEDK